MPVVDKKSPAVEQPEENQSSLEEFLNENNLDPEKTTIDQLFEALSAKYQARLDEQWAEIKDSM